jgi:transcriptional regulator with XRE-family HTH domain
MSGLKSRRVNDLPLREGQTAIISENLKRYRLLKGFKQEQLCAGICSVSQLSKIETGKANVKAQQLQAFADRLGVTLKALQAPDSFRERLQEQFLIAKRAHSARMTERSLELTEGVIVLCRSVDSELLAEAAVFKSRLLAKLCRWSEAIVLLTDLLASGLHLRADRLAELWGELGYVQLRAGDPLEALRCFQRFCDCMPQIPADHPQALRFACRHAMYLLELQNFREARRSAERAQQLAAAQSKHLWRWRANRLLALALHALEERETAYALLQANWQEAEENQIAAESGGTAVQLGILYRRDGDLIQARLWLLRGIKHLDLVGAQDPTASLLPYLELAEVEGSEGSAAKAEQWLQRVEQGLPSATGATYRYEAKCLLLRATLLAQTGDEAAALRLQRQALALYERHNAFFEGCEAAVQIAQRYEATRPQEALELYRRSVAWHREREKRLARGGQMIEGGSCWSWMPEMLSEPI